MRLLHWASCHFWISACLCPSSPSVSMELGSTGRLPISRSRSLIRSIRFCSSTIASDVETGRSCPGFPPDAVIFRTRMVPTCGLCHWRSIPFVPTNGRCAARLMMWFVRLFLLRRLPRLSTSQTLGTSEVRLGSPVSTSVDVILEAACTFSDPRSATSCCGSGGYVLVSWRRGGGGGPHPDPSDVAGRIRGRQWRGWHGHRHRPTMGGATREWWKMDDPSASTHRQGRGGTSRVLKEPICVCRKGMPIRMGGWRTFGGSSRKRRAGQQGSATPTNAIGKYGCGIPFRSEVPRQMPPTSTARDEHWGTTLVARDANDAPS